MKTIYEEDYIDHFIPYATKKVSTKLGIPIDKVKIVWNNTELEYCIYIDGKWCGYYNLDENDNLCQDCNYYEYNTWLEVHRHCDIGSWDCPDPEDCPHKKNSAWGLG